MKILWLILAPAFLSSACASGPYIPRTHPSAIGLDVSKSATIWGLKDYTSILVTHVNGVDVPNSHAIVLAPGKYELQTSYGDQGGWSAYPKVDVAVESGHTYRITHKIHNVGKYTITLGIEDLGEDRTCGFRKLPEDMGILAYTPFSCD